MMALVERTNSGLERLIDRGVELDAEQGAIVAWVFMNRHGIGQDVIIRVLSGPDARRPAMAHATAADDL